MSDQYGFFRPRPILHGKAAVALAAATTAYAESGQSWLTFALLFLAPDLSMLGYLVGPRVGSAIYNLGHTYILAAALAAYGFWRSPVALGCGLIWISHIGFDRLLGYGLKYPTAFGDTHLSSHSHASFGTPDVRSTP